MNARVGFVAGVSAALDGMKAAFSIPEVGRAYLRLAITLLLATVALDFGGIAAVWHYTAANPDATWWLAAGMMALRLVGIILVLLIAPVAGLLIVNNVAPFLAERVFLASLASVAPTRAAELAAWEGLPWVVSLRISIVRFVRLLATTALAFGVSLIPVAGAIGGPLLGGYFSARALAWELLDPYFDKLRYSFAEQRSYVKERQQVLLGFGLPLSFAMAIPLLGPLLFGLAQAAAGRLVGEILETNGPAPRGTSIPPSSRRG